jgi:hypothetical protein
MKDRTSTWNSYKRADSRVNIERNKAWIEEVQKEVNLDLKIQWQ